MDSKSIAIVVPSLADGGGVPAVARFLCETIARSKVFDYRLFSVPSSSRDPASVRLRAPSTWFRGPLVKCDTWEGRDYLHVGSTFAEFEFQRYRSRRLLTHELRKCDLIQVVCGNPAWGLIAKDAGRPVVLQVATLAARERELRLREETGFVTVWRRFMTQITAYLDRKGVELADLIFVENAWMDRILEEWTDADKVVLAPPGVDTELFCPASETSSSEMEYILSVGRFDDRRKNVQLLFEAYSHLREIHEGSPDLVLVGKTGPRDQDWAHAQRLGIREHVHFYENVSRSRLSDFYCNALVFVLSSSEEGLGIVILEAMASGVPVVSTATEGACQALDEGATGILTPVGEACRLAEAMGCMLENPDLRRKMGRKGRTRVEQLYSREAAGRRFLTGYRKLLTV